MACAEAHLPAAPAERDPAVARRAEVVEQRAAVVDVLAAGPADLLEHVGYGLGHDDVAGGDGVRVAEPGEAGGGAVDAEHRSPGMDGAGGRHRRRVAAEPAAPACARGGAPLPRSPSLADRAPAVPAARSPRRGGACRRGRQATRTGPTRPRATAPPPPPEPRPRGTPRRRRPSRRPVPRSSRPGAFRRSGTRRRPLRSRTRLRFRARRARTRGTPRPRGRCRPGLGGSGGRPTASRRSRRCARSARGRPAPRRARRRPAPARASSAAAPSRARGSLRRR